MKIEVNGSNFDQEVISSDIPVLVDFWAAWCGPCKMIEPVIDELSEELKGQVKVAGINIDENPELAAKYNVMSIPTIALFKNGQIADKIVGAVPKNNIIAKLSEHVSL